MIPTIERVRHELKRRKLTVARSETLTPAMLRLTLTGDDLADFNSLAPDDHVKLFIPTAGEAARRDYTPRGYDRQARSLTIDFAIHEAGPATRWALNARPGDTIEIGGPRGSAIVSSDVRHWLLIGDETALPAIGRRIEEAAEETQITSVVAVAGAADEQSFETGAALRTHWIHRPMAQSADPAPLLAACRTIVPEPETFVWIAAEATVARALRAHWVTERGLSAGWWKAAGYWAKGKADAHESLD